MRDIIGGSSKGTSTKCPDFFIFIPQEMYQPVAHIKSFQKNRAGDVLNFATAENKELTVTDK